jgi:hypothetical protein
MNIAQSLQDFDDRGRGESNTPFPGEICKPTDDTPYFVAGVGVDQVRIVLSLSGESARLCDSWTDHDYRPRGLPSMRMVGGWVQGGFKRTFGHLLGEGGPRLLYHRDSAMLHVDIHFDALVPVRSATERATRAVDELKALGIETVFPVRVARADFTGDVVFRSPAEFRYVFSAFDSMVCERGRVVEPFKRSTLYLNASRSARAMRLGRIYDKGAERAAAVREALPSERYLRVEAERLWARADRPLVTDVDSEVARVTFLDRFGAVGRGRVSLAGGLAALLMGLRREGAISVAQYEQLYTFLDHEKVGLARSLYSSDTYRRRASRARELGLGVPAKEPQRGAPVEGFDVRALVEEIAARF